VVEDDFKSADLIRVNLEAEGFTVVHASSAEEALVLSTSFVYGSAEEARPAPDVTADAVADNLMGATSWILRNLRT